MVPPVPLSPEKKEDGQFICAVNKNQRPYATATMRMMRVVTTNRRMPHVKNNM